MKTNTIEASRARLNVFLARDVPVGVVLRRGPAKWVRMSKWNLKNDTFEHGQWFRGRVSDETCDVSPDGTYFIYGAYRENRGYIQDEDIGWCWSAISIPPYFTALALWGGSVNHGGGGRFLDDSQIAINVWNAPDNGWQLLPSKGSLPRNVTVVARELRASADPDLDLWLHRGWREEEGRMIARDNPKLGFTVLKKKLRLKGDNPVTELSGHFQYYVETKTGPVGLTGVNWADWDYRGRLVFARSGKLFAADMAKLGFEAAVELADFNDMAPETVVAPRWAKKW